MCLCKRLCVIVENKIQLTNDHLKRLDFLICVFFAGRSTHFFFYSTTYLVLHLVLHLHMNWWWRRRWLSNDRQCVLLFRSLLGSEIFRIPIENDYGFTLFHKGCTSILLIIRLKSINSVTYTRMEYECGISIELTL